MDIAPWSFWNLKAETFSNFLTILVMWPAVTENGLKNSTNLLHEIDMDFIYNHSTFYHNLLWCIYSE